MIRVNATNYLSIEEGLNAATKPTNTVYFRDKLYIYNLDEQSLTDVSSCISNALSISPIQGIHNIHAYFMSLSPLVVLADKSSQHTIEIWKNKTGFLITSYKNKDTENFNNTVNKDLLNIL